MQHKFVVARLHHRTRAALVGCAACTHFGFTHHAAFGVKRTLACNAVVDDIHHTTNGTAAVQQSGGATQDFNALGGEGVNRHSMVIAQARHVHVGPAVLQNANAVTVHAANDGAAHIRAKRAVGNAGQIVECFTQGAALALGQGCARELLGWHQQTS